MTTSDGLLISLYGPLKERRIDLKLLRDSGWEEKLQEILKVGILTAEGAWVVKN